MKKYNNDLLEWVQSEHFIKKANKKSYKHLDKNIIFRDFSGKKIRVNNKTNFNEVFIRYNSVLIPSLDYLDTLLDPNKIKSHKFTPFFHVKKPKWKISWEKKSSKKSEKWRKKVDEIKTRPILYASHKDSLIYQFLWFKWHTLYEKEVIKFWLNNVALAYRKILDVHWRGEKII